VSENSQRPSSLPGHGGGGRHINMIDVRTFFAVYLDRDKTIIDDLGNIVIFETFMGHDVTPMASGISDRHKTGLSSNLALSKAASPHGYQSQDCRHAATIRTFFTDEMIRGIGIIWHLDRINPTLWKYCPGGTPTEMLQRRRGQWSHSLKCHAHRDIRNLRLGEQRSLTRLSCIVLTFVIRKDILDIFEPVRGLRILSLII